MSEKPLTGQDLANIHKACKVCLNKSTKDLDDLHAAMPFSMISGLFLLKRQNTRSRPNKVKKKKLRKEKAEGNLESANMSINADTSFQDQATAEQTVIINQIGDD